MPRKNAALPLVAVAALGLVTGCEKPSPIVTVTADGVVVTAHATRYCRPGETEAECNTSNEAPVIEVNQGDTLGIDVPRSLAHDGWSAPGVFGEGVSHDHYRSITVPQFNQTGDLPLVITRDPAKGVGEWRFILRLK